MPQQVLVPLEGAPKSVVVVGVAADPGVQLLAGEGPAGLEQGGDEVHESLETVHRMEPTKRAVGGGATVLAAYSEAINFSTRSSFDLNGSLYNTVRWA